MSVISVAILVTQGFSTYHVSIPLILFGETLTDQQLFTRLICAEKPGLIWSDEGTAIQADHGLDMLAQVDIVIVPFWGDVHKRPSEPLLNALVKAREAGAQIVGLCLGSFVLAYAGLLDEHMAVTHWEYEEDFRKLFPSVHLNLNALYVEDDGLTTSAGTAAAMDCCYISFVNILASKRLITLLVGWLHLPTEQVAKHSILIIQSLKRLLTVELIGCLIICY